jgi:predicted AAA+ superfamily ATPase
MQRFFKQTLCKWKNSPTRIPLIVSGARQVGKTFIIETFGREEFKNFVGINFEASSVYKQCFETFDPLSILNQLELLTHQKIIPGETLLFLDEIQQCPKALQSLRYFKEQLPDLHLIAAGSLLEFVIRDEDFSYPVGRVQFAKLYPLSFEEFLIGLGESPLQKALASFDMATPPPPAIHAQLLKKVKDYFIVGGMPASVVTFLKTNSYLDVKYAQKALWDAYEADFGKYATRTQHRYLKKIFEEGPKLIGDHVKYSRIDPDLPNPARSMKLAFELLKLAGVLHPINPTAAEGLPLIATEKQHVFKVVFLDIGLVEQVMNVDPLDSDLMTGALAEQFVGQELLATCDPFLEERLFFWAREKTSSSAEVDYVIAYKGHIFPLEVKAGKTGKLRSLRVFMEEKRSLFGVKISQDALKWEKNILSIPFYMVAHLTRLIDVIMSELPSRD